MEFVETQKGSRTLMDFVFCASEKEQKERSFGDALRNIVNITSFTTNARRYLVFFFSLADTDLVFL